MVDSRSMHVCISLWNYCFWCSVGWHLQIIRNSHTCTRNTKLKVSCPLLYYILQSCQFVHVFFCVNIMFLLAFSKIWSNLFPEPCGLSQHRINIFVSIFTPDLVASINKKKDLQWNFFGNAHGNKTVSPNMCFSSICITA